MSIFAVGGEDMADKHDKNNADYRKHITAAKAWIGQAEESIDKDNEIRSDLNLMLAQAELQRAKERDDVKLWKKWLRWTIPWVAALAIAALYFLVLRIVPPNSISPNPLTSGEVVDESLSPQEKAKEKHRSAEWDLYHEDSIISNMISRQNDSHEEDYEPGANNGQQADSIGTGHEHTGDSGVMLKDNLQHKLSNAEKMISSVDDELENKNSIPPEDMQRLMQSAGRYLRE